jgi:hypothetical protein
MRYSVYFFLVQPSVIHNWFSDASAAHRVVEHLLTKRPSAREADCISVRETISNLQAGKLSLPAKSYCYEAFLWALDLLGEPIELPLLVGFRQYDYFAKSITYQLLRVHAPLFPLPATSPPPEVLFLPNIEFSKSIATIRCRCGADASKAVQHEIADILESALEEASDLWAVAID